MWGIVLKRAEKESFIKSFFIFFISLSLLSALVFWYEFSQKRHAIEESVLNEMKVCSFDLKCKQFTFDFVPLEKEELYLLHQDESGYFALFSIPSGKYALKLHFSQNDFDIMLDKIQMHMIEVFLMTLLILALISTVFSLYTLYPLKKALDLTQEFSRDILHDFNTPLSSLRLNVSLLKVPQSENKKVQRIERSIDTMISLGDNLRSYIEGHILQKERIELFVLLKERIAIIEKLYPNLSFVVEGNSFDIHANHDAISRIIDNLLSNAAKYNKQNGSVWIRANTADAILEIEDNGKGIVHPEKVFERFYKEHERGLGIGLHIVKKLCEELNIPIQVISRLNEGSIFTLQLKELTIMKKEEL